MPDLLLSDPCGGSVDAQLLQRVDDLSTGADGDSPVQEQLQTGGGLHNRRINSSLAARCLLPLLVESMVKAGALSKPQRLLQEVSAPVLEEGSKGEVEEVGVFIRAVVAEVDEVFDVVVSAHELHVL